MDLTLNSMMEFEGIFLKSDEDESCKREDEAIQPADLVEVKYTSSNATEDEVANDDGTDEVPLKGCCKETDNEFVSVEQSGDDKPEETAADAAINTDDAAAAASSTAASATDEKSTSSRRKPKYVQKRGRGSALNKKGRKVIPKVAATASNRVLRSKSPGNDVRNQSSRLLSESVEQSMDDDSDEEWSYEDFDKPSKDRGTKSKRKSTKPRKLKLRIRRDYRVVKMVDVGVGDDVVDSDLEKAKLIAAAASEEESNDDSSGEEYAGGGGKVQKKAAKLKGKAKPKGKKAVKDSNAAPVKKKRGPKPKLGGGGNGGGRRTRMSVCKVCGRAFRNVYLKAHMRTHTGEKPFSCEDCGKNFSTDCYLKMHRQSCHQDPEAFQCDICFRNLASRGSLKEHKRTHSDERPFQCHICQKVFRQPALLINHVKTHSTLTPYQCELCGKSYKYKRSMEMHKERIHDGVRKSFPCNICNKVFTRKTKLKDHTNWHFGKSRHLCEHCGKRFLSRKTLRTHLLIHEDKKPYPCEVCGKSFRQAHVLKRHITTHTGIKPFHCDVCGKQFIHRVYLIRHDCPKAAMSNKMAKKEMAPIQNMVMPVYGDALMMGSAMEQFLPDKTFLHNNKAL